GNGRPGRPRGVVRARGEGGLRERVGVDRATSARAPRCAARDPGRASVRRPPDRACTIRPRHCAPRRRAHARRARAPRPSRGPAEPGGLPRATAAPSRDTSADASALGHLRAYLFADAAPREPARAGEAEFFSAPGEGRESVEIARRILEEARRGTPFDRMAV